MEWKSICCVLGAILINLTLGTFYSIGNVVPYVASYMRDNGNPKVTSEHGTWIVATFLFGQGLSIIGGSYIEQHFNSRVACIVGCAVHCASTFLTIWAIKVSIFWVIIIYGFGSGLGCGSAYMASIIAAQKWYPHRKGLFTGLIVAGFGFGGLIFTNLQTFYLNPDNRAPSATTGYFEREVHDRVPNLFLYLGIIFTVVQAIGCLLAFPAPAPVGHENADSSIALQRGRASGGGGGGGGGITVINAGEEHLPDMYNSCSAFNYRIFYIIGLMMMLVSPGVTFVNSLGKRYGQLFITDDRYLATVVAVAAVANATGRLTWGFLTDRFAFSTCFAIKVVLFATLIGLFPFAFVLSSRLCYLIWMLGLFFGFSGTFVLFPVFIEQVFGGKYHGIVYGILYLFLAISAILTSFIIQLTVSPSLADSASDNFMTRAMPCAVIAIGYIISYALYYFAIPIRRLELAIKRRKEVEATKSRSNLANRPDLLVADRNLTNLEQNNAENADPFQKENSLGSIVKFTEAQPENVNKVRGFHKFNNLRT